MQPRPARQSLGDNHGARIARVISREALAPLPLPGRNGEAAGMDFLPDILDHLGKTPREFGALHAHFEGVTTVDGLRVVARMLFQAAFHPLPPGAQVAFHAASAAGAQGEQLGCFEVPPLEDRAVRVSYPLRVPRGSTHVVAFLQAPAPSWRAERVRPAWKLSDTLEIPKASEMEPIGEPELNVGASLLATALMGGAGFAISFNLGSAGPASTATVHKARELPAGLVQAISAEAARPLDAPLVETLWSPGQPLPAAPEVVYARVEPVKGSGVRRCLQCNFEGPAPEYERARSCPSCDAPWA
jgi:hypothetical protein